MPYGTSRSRFLGITRRIAPADLITWEAGERAERRVSMTCDRSEVAFLFLAIIVLLYRKIESLNDIVKHLFMKI